MLMIFEFSTRNPFETMTSLKDTSKWIQSCLLPDHESFADYVINTNPNEFIVIYKTRRDGFKSYKYSVQTDVFNTFIECKYDDEQCFKFINHIAFNEKDQIVFVNGNRQIDSIQILTREKKSYNYEQQLPCGNYFLSINNYIHMIFSQNRHWIG
eukprot:52348_1